MNTTSEPISITEAIRLVIVGVITLLVAFNAWNPTPEQTGAVLGVYAAVSILLSVIARSKSTPTSKVALTNDDVAALNNR